MYLTAHDSQKPLTEEQVEALLLVPKSAGIRHLFVVREIHPAVLDQHNRTMSTLDALIGNRPVRPAVTEAEYLALGARIGAFV